VFDCYRFDGTLRGEGGSQLPGSGVGGSFSVRGCRTRRGTYIRLRQVKCERASVIRRTAQLNFTSEQACKFAANRQPQTRPAIFAAGTGVGLLERLKDNTLFFGWNSDAGVRNLECNNRRCLPENRVTLAPTIFGGKHRETHATLVGELECVGQQVLQHLLQTLGVSDEAARQIWIHCHFEV